MRAFRRFCGRGGFDDKESQWRNAERNPAEDVEAVEEGEHMCLLLHNFIQLRFGHDSGIAVTVAALRE